MSYVQDAVMFRTFPMNWVRTSFSYDDLNGLSTRYSEEVVRIRIGALAIVALLLACCVFGCAQQPASQVQSDVEQVVDFSFTFLLADGEPAANVEVDSGCLTKPENEILEFRATDETGTISARALVPQSAYFYVYPTYRGDGYPNEKLDVELQGKGRNITLYLSEEFSERYKRLHFQSPQSS